MSPAGELGEGCVLGPLLRGWSPGKARMMYTLPASCTWLLSPCSHLPAGRRHILSCLCHRQLHGPGWLQALFEDWLRGRISRLQPSFLSNSLPTVQCRREAPEGLGTSLWLPQKFTSNVCLRLYSMDSFSQLRFLASALLVVGLQSTTLNACPLQRRGRFPSSVPDDQP